MDVQSDNLPYDRVPEDSPNANPITDPIPAPSESATSDEVRSFIFNAFVRQYSIDREQAEELARLWTVGSGRELRKFPARLFVEIFGLQAGWVLYKEVSARVIEEKVKTMDVFDYRKRESTMVWLVVLDVVLAVLWVFFEPIRLPVGLVFVLATLVILLFAAVGRADVDSRAKPESQLRWLFRER